MHPTYFGLEVFDYLNEEVLIAESSSVVDKHQVVWAGGDPALYGWDNGCSAVLPARDIIRLRYAESCIDVQTVNRFHTEITTKFNISRIPFN